MLQQPGMYLGHLIRVPVYADLGAALTVAWILFGFPALPMQGRLLLLIAIMLTILLHELGHALVARWKGMQGITIVISVLGGYCSFMPGVRATRGQALISLAGPMVNALMVVLCWGVLEALNANPEIMQLGSFMPIVAQLIMMLLWVNLLLGLFNILPVYPLDGGQALFHFTSDVASPARARSLTLWTSMATGSLAILAAIAYFHQPPIFIILILGLMMYQAWRTFS